MEQKEFKYFAFISYSSLDMEWGRRVQRKLEHYRMPATLCSEHGWERNPMNPVFFAPTDIQPGGLTEEIQQRLRAARNLIVICSPHSARSEWVGKEIEFFHQLGRTKQIHFFIVDGQPHSPNPETECFNPIVETLGLPEILGANIHERIYRWPWLNKERAYVQLISKLLGVEFDAIWQRHKRLLVQKITTWAIGITAIALMWIATIGAIIPFTTEIEIAEATPLNTNLPSYSGAVMTMYLGDEILTDTICVERGKSVFPRIPQRFYDKEVRITFTHPCYYDVDTLIPLKENVTFNIRRNLDIFGHVRFCLWNVEAEVFVSNQAITISDKNNRNKTGTFSYTTTSDAEGMVDVRIPLENQREFYSIEADVPLESSTIIMPCGENDAIIVKHEQ
jgi:hypothetical protein